MNNVHPKKIKYIEPIHSNKNNKKENRKELKSDKSSRINRKNEIGTINIKPINKNSLISETPHSENLKRANSKNYNSNCLTAGNDKKEEEMIKKEILRKQKSMNQNINKRVNTSIGKSKISSFHSNVSQSLPKNKNNKLIYDDDNKSNLDFSSDSKRLINKKYRNRSALINKNINLGKRKMDITQEIKIIPKNIPSSKSKRPKSNMIFRGRKVNINNSNEGRLNNLTLLTFQISSNWGNNTKISINSITLFNIENEIINIEKGKIDKNNPWNSKYSKSEIKKLKIYFLNTQKVKSIEIFNGFNDSGIKNICIIQDEKFNIWKGVIPKINQLSNKTYKIEIEQYKFHHNKKNLNKENNNSNKELKSGEVEIKKVNIDLFDDIIERTKRKALTKMENESINYELCNKLKINFINNYGNNKFVGLTGIEFLDDNNKIISLNKNIKSINSNIGNSKGQNFILDKKVINNLFNPKNEINNQKYMFLTYFKNAFIEIYFSKFLKIKQITIYNYNCPYFLDCCTKELKISFYRDTKLIHSYNKIFLLKPPGEEGIDYSQNILFPFNNKRIPKEVNNKNILSEKSIFNFSYYCPYCPSGFVIKIELLSTYGNKEYIGLNSIEIINDKNENIFLKGKIFFFPDKVIINPGEQILGNFSNINQKVNGGMNRIIIMFDELEIINCIKFINYEKYKDIAVKEIKILIDEYIVYEGYIKNKGETIIAFNEKYLDQDCNKENFLEENYEILETSDAKILKLQNY